jgi:hypothetical protein
MKKVETIKFLLAQDLPPKDIAKRVGCALSHVYQVRGLANMAKLRHEIAVLREDMKDFDERIRLLEGTPKDFLERMLSRRPSR